MADGASLPMGDWLRALHLEQYAENFERNELWRVSDCQHLSDEALTRLGILLPGHRRRILSGLLKAFTEALPAMDAPKLPPRRPVPMKRNIFRAGAAAAASSTEQEAGSDSATEASPPRQQLETAPTPPPIPPRTSCHPPVKFSSTATSELPAGPSLLEFTSPAMPPARGRLSPDAAAAEEMANPPLPPLPAKRHHLEGKPPTQKAPPVPSRPPTLPPRGPSQKAAASPPVKDHLQDPEQPPALFPRLNIAEQTGIPEPPLKPPLLFHTDFDDSDYEDPPFEEETEALAEEMTDKVGPHPWGGHAAHLILKITRRLPSPPGYANAGVGKLFQQGAGPVGEAESERLAQGHPVNSVAVRGFKPRSPMSEPGTLTIMPGFLPHAQGV
nr:arf-GAP with Rho-GAP domain, ANK repeat and PH domain-containing protein 1-like [Zootoca vivipara]